MLARCIKQAWLCRSHASSYSWPAAQAAAATTSTPHAPLFTCSSPPRADQPATGDQPPCFHSLIPSPLHPSLNHPNPDPLTATAFRRLHTHPVQRDANLATLQPEDIQWFRDLLGDAGVVTDPERLEPHNRDWMHKYQGSSQLLLRPRSSAQVSSVLRYCSLRQLAVVPQGGNTGLVGGGVPLFDEVILSLQYMNKVISFNQDSGVLVAEAGCVLQTLEDHVAAQGWIMPLDLGAKGSCFIGGNVSTNAGGLRLLRYGSLHGTVLGVEAVLADGTVLDLLKTLRKDNTGYDLKQLFIGAEGTLGVVTAVAIQCAPRPASVQSVFLACPSFAAVLTVLGTARRMLAEILSAAEFLDATCMQLVQQQLDGVSNPLGAPQAGAEAEAGAPPFYMLLETHGSHAAHDVEKLETFLEEVMNQGHVLDGCVAQSQAQTDMMWRVREGISEACAKRGAVYKYDVSMPVEDMYRLVEDVRRRLDEGLPKDAGLDVQAVGYGHVGDGNLHLNVTVPSGYDARVQELLEPFVYQWTTDCRGSISAEHGIGQMKAGALHFSKSREAVAVMSQLKRLFDPKGILSPYKVLPPAGADGA